MREEAGIQVPIKGSYRNVAFRLYFACYQKKWCAQGDDFRTLTNNLLASLFQFDSSDAF